MSRIVMLVDSSGIGGIERHIAILTAALLDSGHRPHILLLKRHGDNQWTRQLDADRLPYSFLGGGVLALARYLETTKTALLHTHGYKAGVLGRIAGVATGVPVVSTFHAGEIGPFPVGLYQRLDELSSLAARRICVSREIARRLPYKSVVIPNFTRVGDTAPTAPLPGVIGFVGRLSPEKGPEIFCRAAACSGVDARWEIFGDGPLRVALQREYGHAVLFHGFLSDTRQLWPRLGLLVISSFAEGLPMVALEAMAAGIPVAATSTGALPELIDHGRNGWLFDVGDAAALLEIVKEWRARKDAVSPQWRQAAWRTARDGFGLENGKEKTLAIYRSAGYAG